MGSLPNQTPQTLFMNIFVIRGKLAGLPVGLIYSRIVSTTTFFLNREETYEKSNKFFVALVRNTFFWGGSGCNEKNALY